MICQVGRAIWAVLVVTILLNGCATYQTFYDVPPEQLNSSTLRSGDRLQLEYGDGSVAKLTVEAVTDDAIISKNGDHWPKIGVKKLTIEIPANSSDCGSLASWRNVKCWDLTKAPQ